MDKKMFIKEYGTVTVGTFIVAKLLNKFLLF